MSIIYSKMENKKVVMSLSEILEKKEKLAKSKPIQSKNEVKEPVVKSKVISRKKSKNALVSTIDKKDKIESIEKDVTPYSKNKGLIRLKPQKQELKKPKSNVISSDVSKIQSDNQKVNLNEIVKESKSVVKRESDEQLFNKYIQQLNNISGQNRSLYLTLIYNMVGSTEYENLLKQKILNDISSQPFSDVEKLKEYVMKSVNDILVISPLDAAFTTMLKNTQLNNRAVNVVEESMIVGEYINELNIPNLKVINKFPLEYIESYEFISDIGVTDLAYMNFRYASPQMTLSLLNMIYSMNEFNKDASKNIILSSLNNFGDKLNIRELILSLPVDTALKMLLGEKYDEMIDKDIYEKFYTLITKTSEQVKGGTIDYPDYEENIFGGTFSATRLNKNTAIIDRLPDSEIKITSIPLTSKIVYNGQTYYKMTKDFMNKVKKLIEEGEKVNYDNFLVIYSDKSMTTRTVGKTSDFAGSFMEGVGILQSYNQSTGKYIIKNQDGNIVEKLRNYFILCQKQDQEFSSKDKKTLGEKEVTPTIPPDELFIDPNIDENMLPEPLDPNTNYTSDELPMPSKIQDLPEMNDDSMDVNLSTSAQPDATKDYQTLPLIPTTTTAAETILPPLAPLVTVTPPSDSDKSSVKSLNSASSTISESLDSLVIAPDTSSDSKTNTTAGATDATAYATSIDSNLDTEKQRYLDNLINNTNQRLKIQSFKKIFETKRPNNPVLYTYLISL